MTRLAEQAKASFDAGLEPVNSSLAATSRRDLAHAQRIRAELSRNQALAVLASLLGHDAEVAVHIDTNIGPMQLARSDEQAWLQLAEQEEGVHVAKEAVLLADAGKLHALGGAMPKVQLVAGWDNKRSTAGTFGSGSDVKSTSIGVEFTMPLYAGGSTWAQQRKSEQESIRADADLSEAQRHADLATRQAWLQWQASGVELQAMQAALASARSEQVAAHAGFDVGLRTLSEVLDAEDRLAGVRAALADSVAAHGLSVLQLHAAVGALDNEQVEQVQTWLTQQ